MMESEPVTVNAQEAKKLNRLNTVTPLSKYLALTIFISLPFIGGWVGYSIAPERVVEVEKIVEVEKVVGIDTSVQTEHESIGSETESTVTGAIELYKDESLGFSVQYSADWRFDSFQGGIQFFNYPESEGVFAIKWPEGANKVESRGGIEVNLNDIKNLSDYILDSRSGVRFYRLDPRASNEEYWISILIPYPQDEARALSFAVYGHADTREEMLNAFIDGFSFTQN